LFSPALRLRLFLRPSHLGHQLLALDIYLAGRLDPNSGAPPIARQDYDPYAAIDKNGLSLAAVEYQHCDRPLLQRFNGSQTAPPYGDISLFDGGVTPRTTA
jgi:hypothetical protein